MITKENLPYYYYYSSRESIFPTKFYATINDPLRKYHIRFHLPNLESAFQSINLYEEPKETLNDLYKDRAIQLRQDYDYLILFYSGGYDSHNILETFMRNNIYLDEILISDFMDNDKKNLDSEKLNMLLHEGRAFETEKAAIPLAKFYVENFSPHTKITYFSKIFHEHLNFWKNINNSKKIAMNLKNSVSELIGNRPVWRSRNPNLYNLEWRKIRDTKKTAFIWGREKPDVKKDNNGFYFHFNDNLFLNCYDTSHVECLDGQPLYHEYFYIHPKATKLFIKQAHVMVKKLPIDFFTNTNRTWDTREYQDKVSNIIYNIKTPIPYTEFKTADLFLKFVSNPNAYPNLLKVAQATGVETIKIMGPFVTSVFLEKNTMEASENHKKYVDFILQNFFSNLNTDFILHGLTQAYVTDKFYFKNNV